MPNNLFRCSSLQEMEHKSETSFQGVQQGKGVRGDFTVEKPDKPLPQPGDQGQ